MNSITVIPFKYVEFDGAVPAFTSDLQNQNTYFRKKEINKPGKKKQNISIKVKSLVNENKGKTDPKDTVKLIIKTNS